MSTRNVAFTVFFLLAVAASLAAQPVSDTKWHANPVSNEYMNNRVDALAIQYKDYAIPKTGLFDIGYPKDAAEYQKLDGHGLLLLAVLSQTKEELPLRRVYVSVDGKQIDLVKLQMYLSENPNTSTQAYKTFGKYRMDAIYVFPVYLRYKPAEIYMEWSKDPKAMVVARFDGTTTSFLESLPGTPPKGKTYPPAAVNAFMRREYPGYFGN